MAVTLLKVGKEAYNEKNLSINKMISKYFFAILMQIFYILFGAYVSLQSIYHRIQLRYLSVTYHQNRSPELISQDVSKFTKIPRIIGAVLRYKDSNEEGGGLEGLLNETSDLAAWCIGSSIEGLIIYERRGILKTLPMDEVKKIIDKKLEKYFGADNVPTIKLNLPYTSASYSDNSTLVAKEEEEGQEEATTTNTNGSSTTNGNAAQNAPVDLQITFLGLEDGRQSIVDLARSCAQLAKEKKLKVEDISVSSLDHELKTLVCEEPDLIYVFGPRLDLDGFPPWHMRLSEIFYMPDNQEVAYSVFLKGLEKYSGVKMNLGR